MKSPALKNRLIVEEAFRAWASGGDFFSILADDAEWTIMGSGPTARTYRGRQAYVDAAVTPLMTRLSEATVPHVRHIWAAGDYVIVRWDQNTLANDGQAYRNNYAWFLLMQGGRIANVTAFLDLSMYDDLLKRLPNRVR